MLSKVSKHCLTVLLAQNESSLPPITSILNNPDGMSDIEQYIGNARVDKNSCKIVFNLLVESDMLVSESDECQKEQLWHCLTFAPSYGK